MWNMTFSKSLKMFSVLPKTIVATKRFEKDLQLLNIPKRKKEKRYKLKISEREIKLLVKCYEYGLRNENQLDDCIQTLLKGKKYSPNYY